MKSEMRPWEETRENNAPPRGVVPVRAAAAAAAPTMQTVSGYYSRCLQETRRPALLESRYATTSKCVDAAAKDKREAKTPSAPSCLTTGTRLGKKKRKEKNKEKKRKRQEGHTRCRPDLGRAAKNNRREGDSSGRVYYTSINFRMETKTEMEAEILAELKTGPKKKMQQTGLAPVNDGKTAVRNRPTTHDTP